MHVFPTERIWKSTFPYLDTLGVTLGYGGRPHLVAVGQYDRDSIIGKKFERAAREWLE
jgi:hypothetical protein